MSTSTAAPGPGRPREFDADDVLDRAVQLFWEKGFEATSVADIVDATGLNKSSLYNTFGSKEALFGQVVERYVEMRVSVLTDVLINGEDGLDDIERFLQQIESGVEDGSAARGCLAVNTTTELGYRDDAARDVSARYRAHIRVALGAAFQRAEARAEIPVGSAGTCAEFLVPWLLGMAVVMRGGAERAELEARFEAVRAVLDGWRLD